MGLDMGLPFVPHSTACESTPRTFRRSLALPSHLRGTGMPRRGGGGHRAQRCPVAFSHVLEAQWKLG